MESLSSSDLVETANEELQILQTLHPHRFEYLKLELESFIFLLREHHTPPPIAAASSSVALTQVSSTIHSKHAKKIRKNIELLGNQTSSLKKKKKKKNMKNKKKRTVTKSKNRVDIVLERARLCLQKIKDVKSSLF